MLKQVLIFGIGRDIEDPSTKGHDDRRLRLEIRCAEAYGAYLFISSAACLISDIFGDGAVWQGLFVKNKVKRAWWFLSLLFGIFVYFAARRLRKRSRR